MNEDRLIQKLKQLRRLEPSGKDLQILHDKVFSRVKEEEYNSWFNLWEIIPDVFSPMRLRPAIYGVLAVLLFIILSAAVINRNNHWWQLPESLVAQIEVITASNKYEKAKVALNLSRIQLMSLKSDQGIDLDRQIEKTANALSKTNTYLASLNLMGEKGKYTNKDCLNIYKEYDQFLGELKNEIDGQTIKTSDETVKKYLQNLQTQVMEYDQQAEKRLKLY